MVAEKYKQIIYRAQLVAGIMAASLVGLWNGGTIALFNVYALPLKQTFNYTQFDVDIQVSLLFVGRSNGIPAGIIHDRFGPCVSSTIGFGLVCIGYLLLWTATSNPFYANYPGLLALYFLTIGHGVGFMYTSTLVTNLRNFQRKHAGKVMAILMAFRSGGPSLLALIYALFYVNGHITDELNQDWQGFIFLLLIGSSISNLICVILLRDVDDPYEEMNNNILEDTDDEILSDGETKAIAEKDDSPVDRDPGSEVFNYDRDEKSRLVDKPAENQCFSEKLKNKLRFLVTWQFQVCLWTSALQIAIGKLFITNITIVAKAYHFEEWNSTFTVLIPVVGIFSSFANGLISDFLQGRVSRGSVLLVGTVIHLISHASLIAYSGNLTVLFAATIGICFSYSGVWTLITAILKEILVEPKYFARDLGVITLITSFCALLLQTLFGFVYDEYSNYKNECYGVHCFQTTFIVTTALAFLAVIVNVILILNNRHAQSKN